MAGHCPVVWSAGSRLEARIAVLVGLGHEASSPGWRDSSNGRVGLGHDVWAVLVCAGSAGADSETGGTSPATGAGAGSTGGTNGAGAGWS